MTADRPTTLLAELTHRCPLHCPYCSNPLEMVRAQRRAGHRGLEAGLHPGARARRAPARPLRRRAAGAQGPRGAGGPRPRPRPLHHPGDLRSRPHPGARGAAARGRPGAHPDLDPGRRPRGRGEDRRRQLGEAETGRRRDREGAGLRVLHQRGAAPGQPRPYRRASSISRPSSARTGWSWPTPSTTAGPWRTARC